MVDGWMEGREAIKTVLRFAYGNHILQENNKIFIIIVLIWAT